MEALLSLRSVWLSFSRGHRHVVRVLANVSLDLRVGEVVAVIAQRAQGKTALLRVAAGIERPDRGSVVFAGEDVWRRPRARGRSASQQRSPASASAQARVALIGHDDPDLDVPVLAGIALPLARRHGRSGARERAERALQEVDAQECAERHWSDLTDFERARVAIAKASARDPLLLLVDDLTATLGLGETEEVARLLHMLAAEHGLSVLMSVGDACATGWSERVATLAGGELLAPAPTISVDSYSNVVGFPK